MTAASGIGLIAAENLPAGWVSVISFPFPGTDLTDEYHGPMLVESESFIRVEVWGSTITFRKNDVILTRSVHDMAVTS